MWKNVVAISRRHALLGRALLVILPVLVLAVRFAPEDYYGLGQFLTVLSLFVFVGYAALVAPSTKLAGMTLDIPHFALLKSMPIAGRQLILGEVMGPFCVIYGAVLLAYLVWVVAYTGTEGMPIDSVAKLKVAIVLLPFLASWIFIQITIRNLMLLYFPAYAGFGATRQDYDATGQKLLGYVVHILVLLVFTVPAVLVGGIVFIVHNLILEGENFVSAVLAINFGSLALFAEALILIQFSRTRYQDFDIPAER